MEFEDVRKVVKELPDGEAGSLLFQIYLRLMMVKETEYSESAFVHDVENIYKTMMKVTNRRAEASQPGSIRRMHILLGESPAGSLKIALKQLKLCDVEGVVSLHDLFSIGPIWRLYEKSGEEARWHWMRNVINDEYDGFHAYKKSFDHSVNQILAIPEEMPIMIWAGDNAHEQTGLRYVLHLLQNRTNEIFVINTPLEMYLEHDNKEYRCTFKHMGEIGPNHMQEIYVENITNAPLTQHQRMELAQEWLALTESQDVLRIWRNGEIKPVPEDFYDGFIIERAKLLHENPMLKGFMKSARLVGDVLGNLDQYIGDEFLEYRLRALIDKGMFEMKGSLKTMSHYSVKLHQIGDD
ncbi:DUF1835 domain-containing protein [Paenibacillus spongiae]|uniref:DUF1835 domain-containing protein n=1 Tax=Paenibacillus spongiae TaxID=2909671 RepID=A0ABY5S267_9BACL|nr:DUF1835 domain-containing protein [Paenibacillus spongiae]UVI27754.1 DUF1835 domain-containing protein [Paenibacillus spongiae]